MISIFNNKRGFIPTSIFIPQLLDYTLSLPEIIQPESLLSKNIAQELDVKTTFINNDEQDTNYKNSELTQAARIAFEKFKKKDPKLTQSVDISYEILEKKFYELIEQSAYDKAEEEYKEMLAKKEQKLYTDNRLREAEEQKEEIEYNIEYEKKLLEKKRRVAEKKRRTEFALEFFMGLLLGDPNDTSIPKPFLSILTNFHPGFIKLYHLTKTYVQPVTAISPIMFRYGHQFHRMHKEVTIKCNVKPFIQQVFAGIYRHWCEQFAKKIIEKHQRGPPNKIRNLFI